MGTPLFHVGAHGDVPARRPGEHDPGQPAGHGRRPAGRRRLGDTFLVAGCAFTVPHGKPQPCVKVQWLVPAMRVKVGGQPAILQSSNGLCQSAEQIPAGTAVGSS